MPRAEARSRGLFRHGKLWWVRVYAPSGAVARRSTGTPDLETANRTLAMLDQLTETRENWEWLELAASGAVALDTLYNHFSAGTLQTLRQSRQEAAVATSDVDLGTWVDRWDREHLAVRERAGKISGQQRADYVRQVRTLIPAGTPFPRSRFTEDVVKSQMEQLTNQRNGNALSTSTLRRYVVAWSLFAKWARRRVPLTVNPFEFVEEWMPVNASPRSMWWDHQTRLSVVNALAGEARVFMALVLGTGIERGAAEAMHGRDISRDDQTVVAHGTKNGAREDRTVFVDSWAWPIVRDHCKTILPTAPVFTISSHDVLHQLYEAQVRLGLVKEPPRSEKTGKKLWKAAAPHTIHDARHTFCFCRLLGLDGEPRQDIKFCSTQLGHSDEQMVMRVYGKANIREKLRVIELREARQAGAADAAREAR